MHLLILSSAPPSLNIFLDSPICQGGGGSRLESILFQVFPTAADLLAFFKGLGKFGPANCSYNVNLRDFSSEEIVLQGANRFPSNGSKKKRQEDVKCLHAGPRK